MKPVFKTVVWLVVGLALMPFAGAEDKAQYALVVHAESSLSLDQKDIARLFLGKIKVHVEGAHVVPYMLDPSSDVGAAFLKAYLRKRPTQYKSHWMNMVFTGEGHPPEVLKNDAEMLKVISKHTNAIGIMKLSSVDKRVKVVARF